jgi:hypothetical protein
MRYNDSMSVTTFKIGKKEYVLLTRKRYEQLTRGKRYEQLSRAEQDAVDSEIGRKGIAAYRSGKIKPIPLQKARRKWGV